MTSKIRKAWKVLRGPSTESRMRQLEDRAEIMLNSFHSAITLFQTMVPRMETHQAFLKLNEEHNRLARFIRTQYADEIAAGKHKRFDSLGSTIISYLMVERAAKFDVVERNAGSRGVDDESA